jgi:23S rRNA (cytidine1920-2'-O)/16S rRNA (cytidine1409-2'-O)-methyltransferase
MDEKRLDHALCALGSAPNRTAAQASVKAGLVTVNGKTVTKPGLRIRDGDTVELLALPHDYVSRGGVKLQYALESAAVSVSELTVLDAGSGTGGFTDCLLRLNAEKVYAVDVGKGQLAQSLRDDPRVVVTEQTDIRSLILPQCVDLITADLSFISLTLVIPHLKKFANPMCQAFLLVKPQFETPPSAKNKRGVVKHQQDRERAVERVTLSAEQHGWRVHRIMPSPILGGEGNTEYWLCLDYENNTALPESRQGF